MTSKGTRGAPLGSVDEEDGLQRTKPTKRESFSHAIIQVVVATVIFAGLLFLYYRHVQTQEKVRELASNAKEKMTRNGPKDLAAAEKLFLSAYDLDSSHPYVLSALGLLDAQQWVEYGIQSKQADAEKFTKLAEDHDAHKAERYGARGLILVGEHKYAQAEKMLVQVVNDGGLGSPIFGALGLAQRGEGKGEAARQALRRAADADWHNPSYNYWVATTYFEDGDYANAKSFIKKALDANPDHLLTLVLRSRVAIAGGEVTKDAHDTIEDVLSRPAPQLTPRLKALALVAKSEMLRYERKPKSAAKAADQAIALVGDLPDAHLAKGLALADEKKATAGAEIQKGLDLYPYSPRAYHVAATTLLADGQADQALKVMNTWGEKVSKDSDYMVAYGNLLMKKGDKDGAMTKYQAAIKLDPDSAEAYYRMGMIQKAAKDYGKAVDMFNKAVSARDQYPEVYEAMGWIYADQGHYDDAVRQFAKALTYYNAEHADRRMMNKLRGDVAKTLKRHHKRSWVRPWLKESRELIR